MKKVLSMLAIVFTLGLTTVAMEADAAKRMGSGKSMGTQRQANVDKTPAAPAQTAAAAPARSWMGPLAGLAAGLGLAALASHLGFGGELASMLMFGLLALAVMAAIGFFMRKRAAAGQQNTNRATGGMAYATANAHPTANSNASYKVSMPSSSGVSHSATPSTGGSMIGSSLVASQNDAKPLPANFDSAAFERNAKVNFIRLQAAYDAENLDDIRQFTSPEMFAEIKMDMAERSASVQKHEVLNISAAVLEVEEASDRYVVSVRFTGTMRDTIALADEAFDEIWHLTKPVQGDSGWVLAGIQQSN